MKKLISIIIPVFNEAKSLEKTFSTIKQYADLTDNYEFEYILVNDGSTDRSLDIIRKLNDMHGVRYINFSRNFGKEAATTAGINKSRGDCAIMIDADGQHPVEIVGEFIGKWQNGYDIVIGVRTSNSGEGTIKKYGSKLFYKIINSISSDNTVPSSTDFRLIDRKVINEFNKLTERGRITRGLIDWLGYRRTYINFIAKERTDGKPSYSYKKLVDLAMHSFIAQTTLPLKAIGVLGALISLFAAVIGLFLVIEMYLLNDPLSLGVTGTALLAVFLSFLVGIVLICQGLLALYMEAVHRETQNRPLYIISESSERAR